MQSSSVVLPLDEASGRRRGLVAFDQILGVSIEVIAAMIVLAEIVVLFSGVVSRYVFHMPIVWSDELASMLFLWLSMLGAVVALRRGAHMRMTAVVSKLSKDRQVFVETFSVVASLAFLLLFFYPAWEYAQDEAFITTPALEISKLWHAIAIPLGCALMIVTAFLRLAINGRGRDVLISVLAVGALVVAFYFFGPSMKALGKANLFIFFVVIVGINVFAGVPIAFSFALATFSYLALTTRTPMPVMVGRIEEGMSHLVLLAVPLFVYLGLLIEMTGMAKAMVQFLASLLGRVRGGLSYVLVGAMYLVSGISGSKIADMAAVAPVLFPEMKERGAKEGDLVALLSVTGAQTETVPPSIVLITIGSVTGVSIAALFTGGLLPGLICGLALCGVVWWRYRHEDLSKVKRFTKGEIAKIFVVALPALVLPFVIRYAVIEGVATATEVSTIGIAYSLLVGLVLYRQFNFKRAFEMLIDTASLSGSIIFIIGCATAMAWALTQSGFSQDLAAIMKSLGGAKTFMAVSIVVFIILGSVLEGIPAIVLFGPLLFPIAREMGIHDVHYSMVVILAMGTGLFAPPFGVGYYGCCAVSKVHPDEGIPYIGAYLAALVLGLVVVAVFPWISLGFL
ncbi:TRAP transporter large permease subunit [Propionivibrio dicarboxylicus]|uniref:TRAP transporter, DctM subunit n=1 Tax=Propionivibrio dicarboxylicus TaxID=83767 RepID=A0A1G8GGH7_9RHOO|nr:TRAP transporter large permease subunit [Propionivibrio dicarboxylicus]SDH93436.1 TRAP transporter, DctM subunit [Propionivibrio dicarboxylicus]